MAVPPPNTTDLTPLPGRDKQQVVVVGAGMAGLAAAYQLRSGGHEVTVLEARLRPGGRVHTVRAPFADGLYAEAGAMFIPSEHEFLMKYVNLFDFTLDPVPRRDIGSFAFVQGQHSAGSTLGWPGLRAEDVGLSQDTLLRKYVGPVADRIGDPADPLWPGEHLRYLDDMTVAELFESNGAYPEVVQLLYVSYLLSYGDEALEMSALFLMEELGDRLKLAGGADDEEQGWNTIRGGNDRLPHALAASMAECVRYGAEVCRIEQLVDSVVVTAKEGGRFVRFTANRVVIAIPFPCLREVTFSPEVSTKKRYAIDHQKTTEFAHLWLQTRGRPWRDSLGGVPAFGVTDLPIGGIRDASHSQTVARGVLDTFTAGRAAQALAAMSDDARREWAVFHLEYVFPGIGELVEGTVWFNWVDEQWSRGDYVFYLRGEYLPIAGAARRSEGRLHFAGDHTSHRTSWQDGAIFSGHRAANEIHWS